MVGEGTAMEPHDFPVFCPVAFAGIGWLPDTLHDRSIIVELQRRALDEPIEPYRARRARAPGLELGRRLAAWAHRHAAQLADADPPMPEGITDRPADVWEPVLAVADVAGGDWPTRARVACLKLNDIRAETDDSAKRRLLVDIHDIFDGRDQIDTATLISELCDIDESPWASWLDGKSDKAKGSWLARQLKPFRVRSTKIRVRDKSLRGYKRSDFTDTWSRYLPPTAPPQTDGTDGTDGTPQVAATSTVPTVPSVPVPDGVSGAVREPATPPAAGGRERFVFAVRGQGR
jgi:hypothetical protein